MFSFDSNASGALMADYLQKTLAKDAVYHLESFIAKVEAMSPEHGRALGAFLEAEREKLGKGGASLALDGAILFVSTIHPPLKARVTPIYPLLEGEPDDE